MKLLLASTLVCLLLGGCTVATSHGFYSTANAREVDYRGRGVKLTIRDHRPSQNVDAVARGVTALGASGLLIP